MAEKTEKSVALFEQKVSPIFEQAQALEIVDEKGQAEAAELLSHLNKNLDAVTKEKEKVTKPLNEALKAERGRWKPLENFLEEGIAIVRRKMGTYQTEATRKAQEEAAKIAARVGDGKGKLKVETAVRKMDEIETPAQAVVAESGMVKFRTVKKFEVMDVTMLPIEYVLPNEPAIRAAMTKGQELPGVRYYEEQVPVNFR